MTVLAGLALIYGPFALAVLLLVWPLRWLASFWDGRDVMDRFRPERRHVNHTEKILNVRVPAGWMNK